MKNKKRQGKKKQENKSNLEKYTDEKRICQISEKTEENEIKKDKGRRENKWQGV